MWDYGNQVRSHYFIDTYNLDGSYPATDYETVFFESPKAWRTYLGVVRDLIYYPEGL